MTGKLTGKVRGVFVIFLPKASSDDSAGSFACHWSTLTEGRRHLSGGRHHHHQHDHDHDHHQHQCYHLPAIGPLSQRDAGIYQVVVVIILININIYININNTIAINIIIFLPLV